MLWVRSLDTAELRRMPGTEGGRSPFWKPDSQALGFFANRQVKIVPFSGGSPIALCETQPVGDVSVQGGTWNDRDVIVFGRPSGPLWRVTADQGADAKPLTTLAKDDAAHRWPSFLPDGEHFLYLAQTVRSDELRIGSLGSVDTISLGSFESHGAYAAGHLFFVRGGNLVAQPFDADALQVKGDPLLLGTQVGVDPPWQRAMFSVSATGQLAYSRTARASSQLTWLDRQGKPVGVVGQAGVYFNVDLSSDETRLAISRMTQQPGANAQFDIWVIDLPRDSPTRLTDDPAWEFDPAWSPDGKQIAFNSNRPEPSRSPYSLWARASNGSGQDVLLKKPAAGSIQAPDWSPDGRFIVYTGGGAGTGTDLWTLSLAGDRRATVFLNARHDEGGGVFSPDARWIAYHSNTSGRNEVYVRPFPVGEGVVPISRDGGWSARWRGDGKELFFLSGDGTMMAATVDSNNGMTAGVPRPLFRTLLRPGHARPYTVTENGQRFLIPIPLPGAPITVVLNWQTALAR